MSSVPRDLSTWTVNVVCAVVHFLFIWNVKLYQAPPSFTKVEVKDFVRLAEVYVNAIHLHGNSDYLLDTADFFNIRDSQFPRGYHDMMD